MGGRNFKKVKVDKCRVFFPPGKAQPLAAILTGR